LLDPAWLYVATYGYLPFITVAVMALGALLRLTHWLNAPSSRATPLMLKGASLSSLTARSIYGLVLDLVFFRRVYRVDPKLWAVTWTMHMCVAILIFSGIHHAAHMYFLGLADDKPTLLLEPYEIPIARLQDVVKAYIPPIMPTSVGRQASFVVGLVFTACLVILLARRLRDPAVRAISSLENFYDLMVLIAGSVIGLAVAFDQLFISYLSTHARVFLVSLHGLIAQLYFMSMPFTFYIHIVPGAELTKVAYELRRGVRAEA